MALLNAKVRSRLKHAIIGKFKHMATKAGNCYTTHSFILLFLLTGKFRYILVVVGGRKGVSENMMTVFLLDV